MMASKCHLRDWVVTLLLIVGFSFGGPITVAASPAGAMCAPIEKWAGSLESLQASGLEPFAFVQADDALIVTLVNPATGQWALFSMHRSGKGGPLVRFCLRAIGEAERNPTYGAGILPAEVAALMKGSGA